MKNIIIAVLACLCVWLLYRDHTRTEAGIRAGQYAIPATPAAHAKATSNQSQEASQQARAEAVQADKPQGILPPAVLAETRFTMLRNIAWRYARFFANHHLPPEKADLLLDLLVDRWMVAFEADIQTGSGSVTRIADKAKMDEATRLNQKMIEELIGADAAKELEKSGMEQVKTAPDFAAIQAINSPTPIPESSRDRVTQALEGFNPSQGTADLITGPDEITPELEQRMRRESSERVEALLSQLNGSITPQQADSFRNWSRAKITKDLEFAKMIWLANHKKG
ncbi:MAG: hypothetical protein WC378_16990 [Opitutaceae bacterium]|jgi:hypothetical protein